MTFEELLAKAEADPRVIGLFLGGSRGKDANVRPDSDFDVRVVIREPDARLFEELDAERGLPVEVAVMTLEELRAYPDWDRPTLTHTRALVDKTGEIQRVIDEKGRLGESEAAELARQSLDAYLNALYRGLKRPGPARRIYAAESVAQLLTCVFALESRVRPFHDYLVWELEHHPLESWPAAELLRLIEGALDAGPESQRELFRHVEPRVHAAGLGEVVDSWEPDVAFLRGE